MSKTSREKDLDKLDQARFDRHEEGSKEHVQAILAMVHQQSKDSILERLRGELIGVLNELEELGEGENGERWNRYCAAIVKIEQYCNSPAFLQSMHAAILRNAGRKEADKYAFTKRNV